MSHHITIFSSLFPDYSTLESKNQESPEQETNGAKADFSALQNPNLLIALAQSGAGSAAAQFAAMPVGRIDCSWFESLTDWKIPHSQHHYQQFLRASQFPVNSEVSGNGDDDSNDESGAENDLDSCNLPLNLVSTQLGDS